MQQKYKRILLLPILAIVSALTTVLVMVFLRTCVAVSESDLIRSEGIIYSKTIQQDTPILLTGNDVLLIEDTDYTFTSSLIVEDNAKIIIKNSKLTQDSSASSYSQVIFSDNSSIEITDSAVHMSGWTPWALIDSSSMTQTNVRQDDANLWLGFEDNSTGNFKDSLFRGSIRDTVKLDLDTPDKKTSIELRFPDNSVVDESLPSNLTAFTLPNANDSNIGFSIDIANAQYLEWSVIFASNANVTIRGGEGINITMDTTGATDLSSKLTDLKAKHFEDSTFNFRGGSMRLIDTGVSSWNLRLDGNNQITLRDSDLTNLLTLSETAKLYAYNSSMDLLSVSDSAYANIQTGVVLGGVIVNHNGIVELVDTKLIGDITKDGEGEVIIK